MNYHLIIIIVVFFFCLEDKNDHNYLKLKIMFNILFDANYKRIKKIIT